MAETTTAAPGGAQTASSVGAPVEIAVTSKSFWLAVQLLPPRFRRDITRLYAWLRYVDDSVDAVPPAEQLAALARLRAELDAVYDEGDAPLPNRLLTLFRELVRTYAIPIEYPRELIAGGEMDARGTRYRTVEELSLYVYRVAGVVGLMLAHVMGVRDLSTLRRAAHLGYGMQMTNMARDVFEDWQLGRLYLPSELLGEVAAHLPEPGTGALPREHRAAYAGAVRSLLDLGDRYYRSADVGIRALPWRCAFAVRAARLIYAGSAGVLRARGHDVFAGRASLAPWRKLALAFRSLGASIIDAPRRVLAALRRTPASTVEATVLGFADVKDVPPSR